MKYLSITDASAKCGLSERRIQQLCASGSIVGAFRSREGWLIPDDALPSRERKPKEKPPLLPIGMNYEFAAKEATLIDKSLLIRDLLFLKSKITLFTRPRRFGKSMNLDMLRCFFEEGHEERAALFQDKAIAKYRELLTRHQGKYPVINLSFLGMDSNLKGIVSKVGMLVYGEYFRHKELYEAKIGSDFFKPLEQGKASKEQVEASLAKLIACFDKPVIVLIDEYDAPIQYAYLHNEFDEAVSFFRNFLSFALKDNPNVYLSVLSGVTRLAKESIFSGFNSVKINGVGDLEFSEYFGFTDDEVRRLLKMFGGQKKYKEAKLHYDGYRFGVEQVFNPWSVANYINSSFRPDNYWSGTSKNDIIEELLRICDDSTKNKLIKLLRGESIDVPLVEDFSYRDLSTQPDAIWPLLVASGYLTKDIEGNLTLPNLEVRRCYEEKIIARLSESIDGERRTFFKALVNNDVSKIEEELRRFLYASVSSLLAQKEDFYHGLLLGMLAYCSSDYELRSEMESGLGRSDILLSSKQGNPAIIIEVKRIEGASQKRLNEKAKEAIQQIIDKNYDAAYPNSILYGIAFSGKAFAIVSDIKTKKI